MKRLFLAVAAGAVAWALPSDVARAVDGTWAVNADGTWDTATNWTSNPAVPNGVGDAARFLNVSTATRTITQNVAGLTLNAIEFNDNNSHVISGPSAITLDGPPTAGASVTVNTSNGSASHTIATDLALNIITDVVTNASAAFPLTFSGAISGTSPLVKKGPGLLLLGGATANTCEVAVHEGTVELFKSVAGTAAIGGSLNVGDGVGGANADIAITRNGSVPNTANVIVNSSGQFQVVSTEAIGGLILSGGSATITAGGGGFTFNMLTSQPHANSATVSGPGGLMLSAATVVQVGEGFAASDLVISAPIQLGGITKQGEGTLVLTANNTHGSPTTISQGTLQVGNGGLTGTLGTGSIVNNGVLAFNRGGAGVTVSQAITGSGGSVHHIGGTTVLTGNNTYTGTTTVSAGLLQIGNSGTTGTLGAGDVIVNGGAIAFQRSDNITVPHNISGAGSVQQFGNGTTNLVGSVTSTGPFGASAGRIIANNSMPDIHSIFVNGNGVAELASNGSSMRVIRARTVTASGTAKVDVKDNKLIFTLMPIGTASGGVYTGISRMIQTGSAAGAWNAPGLTTSMPDAAGGLTALGVATADQAGYAGGTFGGVSVTATDVLVMYTYAGDANLDGIISGDDYAAIDLNIAVAGASGWYNGDFNYDGIISGDDYAAIDLNIVAQGAPFPISAPAGSTAVPEPAAQVVLLPIVAASLRRRRTRLGRASHATP